MVLQTWKILPDFGVQIVPLARCGEVLSGHWFLWGEDRTRSLPAAAGAMVKTVALHLVTNQLCALGQAMSHLSVVRRGEVPFPKRYS